MYYFFYDTTAYIYFCFVFFFNNLIHYYLFCFNKINLNVINYFFGFLLLFLIRNVKNTNN